MENDPIKVYGTRWCWDCRRAKKILNHHQVAYQWIDIDRDAEAKEFVGMVNNGKFVVPTIVFKDGSILSEPTNIDLKTKIEQDIKTQDA